MIILSILIIYFVVKQGRSRMGKMEELSKIVGQLEELRQDRPPADDHRWLKKEEK